MDFIIGLCNRKDRVVVFTDPRGPGEPVGRGFFVIFRGRRTEIEKESMARGSERANRAREEVGEKRNVKGEVVKTR